MNVQSQARVLCTHMLPAVSLFKYRLREPALAFFQQCLNADNPEALFQQEMYFGQVELQEVFRNLERAASLGHNTSAYVLRVILLCCGSEDEKHKDMSLISRVKACARKMIVECRLRLHEFLSNIWLNHTIDYEWKPVSCDKEKQHGGRCRRRCPWKAAEYLLEDDGDTLFCEACSCEYESKFFISLFNRSI